MVFFLPCELRPQQKSNNRNMSSRHLSETIINIYIQFKCNKFYTKGVHIRFQLG